jgi:hypothetical protein
MISVNLEMNVSHGNLTNLNTFQFIVIITQLMVMWVCEVENTLAPQ